MLLFYFTYTEELSVTDVLKHIFQKAARCEKRGERYREEDRERERVRTRDNVASRERRLHYIEGK